MRVRESHLRPLRSYATPPELDGTRCFPAVKNSAVNRGGPVPDQLGLLLRLPQEVRLFELLRQLPRREIFTDVREALFEFE